jgi:hypothetical protein
MSNTLLKSIPFRSANQGPADVAINSSYHAINVFSLFFIKPQGASHGELIMPFNSRNEGSKRELAGLMYVARNAV